MKRKLYALVVAALAGTSACAGDSLKGEGETCSLSAECGDGLFCDLSKTPAVCVKAGGARDMSFNPSDMSAAFDLQGLD